MWASSVDVGGPLVDRLVEACAERGMHLAIGVNEREDQRPGTLYNTLLIVGPDGVLHRHRKLMPTMHERVFHGVGAGDDLGVTELPGIGRVGGLICWENRMPLARWRRVPGRPADLAGPHRRRQRELDRVDAPHRDRVRGLRGERAAVHPRSAFPDDFPLVPPEAEVFGRGGACIVSPYGEVLAGPLYDAEGIVRRCDLREALHAKRYFDVAGHYGRADVLDPGGGTHGERVPGHLRRSRPASARRVLVRGARLHRAAATAGVRHLGGGAGRLRRRPLRPRPCLRHRRPEGKGPRVFFLKVPEGKTVKNRVHLDVNVGRT